MSGGTPAWPALTRRGLLAGSAALTAVSAAGPVRGNYVWQPNGTLTYRVSADDSEIGSLVVNFAPSGAELTVRTQVSISFNVAFVTVFRYEHQAVETWRDGRLVAFTSETDDDGKPHRVDGFATEDGFQINGPEGTYQAPADVMSASYWNNDILTRSLLFDPQDGELHSQTIHGSGRETIRAGGRPIQAIRYDITAKQRGFVWYEDSGRWLASSFVRGGVAVEQRLAG